MTADNTINVLDVTNRGSAQDRNTRRRAKFLADNPHVINQIVDRDLCVRCGACEPSCPVDIIRFDKATAYPYITDETKCVQNCTRCLQVCPGEQVDLPAFDDRMFRTRSNPDSVTGIVNQAVVAFSTDDDIRYGGASGGFVTKLLSYMLDTGIIDGALVLGAADDDGWGEKPFIARTIDDLESAMKSKYRVLPFLTSIREMEEIEGNYAVVALPCYVHALRKYQQVSPKLRSRLKFIIGLLCNVAFEPHIFDELCEFHGVDKSDVTDLQFRGGEWPGGVYATLRDGQRVKALKLEEMKDEFNMLKGFYTPLRCNMCTDFSAEHADLACGDPWLRGEDGQYLFTDGRTSAITRTKLADQMLEEAQEAGYIRYQQIPLELYMANFERSARYKRDFVPAHIKLRKLLGRPVPDFNRPLPALSASTYVRAAIKMAFSFCAKWKVFRQVGLHLAQTKPALAYYRWNRVQKSRGFEENFAKSVKLAHRVSSPPSAAVGETSGFEVRAKNHQA